MNVKKKTFIVKDQKYYLRKHRTTNMDEQVCGGGPDFEQYSPIALVTDWYSLPSPSTGEAQS